MEDKGGQRQFGRLRSMFWPIYNFELKKFLPMSLLMICMLFTYTLLRDLKDTLIQSFATGGGTEMISSLKTWIVIPCSFLFMAAFVKLANKVSAAKVFYSVIIFFVSYFLLFGFVLFPNVEYLHGSAEFIEAARTKVPWLHWIIPCFTNWTYSLAYVLAELWGAAVISLLFWQFANEITKTTEAPRFYSLFGFFGNLGLLASGELVESFSRKAKKTVEAGGNEMLAFGSNLKLQMLCILSCAIVALFTYAWMQRNVLTDPKLYSPGMGKKKSKPKMGVAESFVYVLTNPYILLIALLVLCYGMSLHLNEIIWKAQVKLRFPEGNAYNEFMGGVSKRTGLLTMIIMIVGANVLKSGKWRTSALVTPIFTGVTVAVFFALMLYKEKIGEGGMIWGISLLNACVTLGMYQIACSKGVKYSLFDSTKNMAYLPLESDEKLKAQAAVEVIGGRLGKGSGATIVMILTNAKWFGEKVVDPGNMRIVMGMMFTIVGVWIFAVLKINPRVTKKLEERAREEKEEKATVAKANA
ncbi:MAG: NTP/NDP exchange transporter [Oscillospiraceae bacterium]|jgi:AAA family ATP:ADP antiporter|nr:NTP/NDP exchange transporter [Oscillospiraceae bacterium]